MDKARYLKAMDKTRCLKGGKRVDRFETATDL
jgi:hypothetical protein